MNIKNYSGLVKLSHTIFAMPFALIGFTLGVISLGGIDQLEWDILGKVLLCMLFARNCAMGFNRWADRDIDGQNERTKGREIPAGKISPRRALIFVAINIALFIATASSINSLTAILSPVALAVIMGYSYCKRFTALAHIVLGLSLSIAPMGAYIAVTGKFAIIPMILSMVVLSWCAGFDIIYALQDRDFDRDHGLHSIPAAFSISTALWISIILHIITAISLLALGMMLPYSPFTWIGIGLFITLLAAQHTLVTPKRQSNIAMAFGTINGVASVVLSIFIILGLLL